MDRKVILTAEHHNWGLHTIYDWQQTKYILFEDGTLQSIVFEGEQILSSERVISEESLQFIRDNISDCIYNTPETDACDGEAWMFEGPDLLFPLGYIYGSDLEKIAGILETEATDD